MKKISKILVLTVALSIAATAGVFAQTIEDLDLDYIGTQFDNFSTSVAQSLPFASTTGLNWSDAKVRGFPHFGAGLSVEAVMMPSSAFTTLTKELGYDDQIPDAFTGSLGVPLPGYALDARVGIPLLPIDVGAKAGIMTEGMGSAVSSVTDIDLSYTLLGFDVRYAILDGGLVMPALTVSAGYNYMNGSIAKTIDGMTADASISYDAPDGNTYQIAYNDPKLRFAWKSSNLDFKLQASKGLLIFTPTAGVGYTYGFSSAGGGLKAEIDKDTSDIDEIEEYLDVEIDDQGFTFLSEANGGAFRAFVGSQINLAIFKMDLNVKYNFLEQSFGGGLNLRVQI